MLKTLDIENIAVIEKASVDFSNGLNVLTGETGAGKSIVVDSINAILGERTSRELVRHGADNACVSALFDDIDKSVINDIKDIGFNVDEEGSVLISRRISSSGKSVCKINGSPCTVSMLKDIGSKLVNIHGQHDSQQLLNSDYHYKFVDIISNDKSYLENYTNSFKKFMAVRKKLKIITADEDNKDSRLELLNYQIDELQKADIIVGEKESLTHRKQEIIQIDNIRQALTESVYAITGDENFQGVSLMLADISAKLASFESLHSIFQSATELSELAENLKNQITEKLESIDVSDDELENIEERLDLLYRLSLKYGNTEEEMLLFLNKAMAERESLLYSDKELEKLSSEYDLLYEDTLKYAKALSDYRKTTAKQFESDVCKELTFLDMQGIKFVVDFSQGKLSSTGYDNIEFLISTNPGEPPKPLSKIASGGELSRIMLAIKNIIAHNDTIGTLIFDEIDTGVSGRASRKIGLKLKSVSKSTQVICVTHSAQIASVANEHFLISKQVHNDRTYTKVEPLDFSGRKQELARIMGGLHVTDSLLKSAEELLTSQEDI